MSETSHHLVSRKDRNGVAVLTMNRPPRNGLEPELIEDLETAATLALKDPDVRALVIAGAGTGFASGADLRREVHRPDPALSALCRLLEDAHKPVVAALHGHAVGAGLELALACHFRIAQAETQFSMPDIALGWLPAAGGVQRLTRVVGGRAAQSILLGGRGFGAPQAERLGLVDRLTPEAPLEAAIARALEVSPRPTRKRLDALIHAKDDLAHIAETRVRPGVANAQTPAPAAILDCIEAALTKDMATGFGLEARSAARCATHPAARALRGVFLARRDAARPVHPPATPVTLRRLGILSTAPEATALAVRAARAGLSVVCVGANAEALEVHHRQLDARLAELETTGHVTPDRRAALLANVRLSENMHDVGGCDVVLAPGVTADLSAHLRADAACLVPKETPVTGPQILPCHGIMAARSILELYPGPETSPEARARALALVRRLDQPVVEVPPGHPSILETLEACWLRAAEGLLLEGAGLAQVDAAFAQAGWREGPFMRQDRLGLNRDGSVARIAINLARAGHTGAGAGQGYYLWDADGLVGENPAARAEIEALGGTGGDVEDAEIVPRCMAALSNCAARILGDAGAWRSSDVDAVAVFGLGWPRISGGPVWSAEDAGLGQTLSRIWACGGRDADLWTPAPLLEDAVAHLRETLLP